MKFGLKEAFFEELLYAISSLEFVRKIIIYSDIDLAIDVESHMELLKVMMF